MKIKLFPILITCFLSASLFSQSKLNNYRYVIVPKKYDFLREDNQYQLNMLAKFLFEKYGFETLMEGEEYPQELLANNCLALRSDVLKDSGLFKTKLNVQLKDCNDRIVYTSETGESREKDFARAYNEALRDAFTSFETLGYTYEPSVLEAAENTDNTEYSRKEDSKEVEQLKAEIATLKKEKQMVVKADEVVVVEEPNNTEKIKATISETKKPVVAASEKDLNTVLYAQAIDNGFQLVDSTPKVVYKIKNSGLKDVFFVEGKQAIVYKKGNDWIMEYYEGNSLKQETLPVKF